MSVDIDISFICDECGYCCSVFAKNMGDAEYDIKDRDWLVIDSQVSKKHICDRCREDK